MSFNSFGAKIKVVGVGGGGGNAVNTMIRSGLEGVDFIVANTDAQALKASLAPHKIQLGKELTKGLGAGADPDIGRDAALEDRMELQDFLSDADMVFITAGMGGGTGTGAAAVVAQIARELGALTVAVVTKPFAFEGKRRRKHADLGVARLRECVDTLITIPNQRLLQVATPDLSMLDAFKLADNVLVNAVRGISDIINTPGLINVDFADVKTVMSSMGHALMGIGYGTGTDRALTAARQAISSPLLEDVDIEGATGILINITAGTNVSIMEVNNSCMVIQEAAHEDANIIFGAVIDEALGDEIRITVIATGFPVEESIQPEEMPSAFTNRQNNAVRSTSQQAAQRLVAPPRLTTPVPPVQRERSTITTPSTPAQETMATRPMTSHPMLQPNAVVSTQLNKTAEAVRPPVASVAAHFQTPVVTATSAPTPKTIWPESPIVHTAVSNIERSPSTTAATPAIQPVANTVVETATDSWDQFDLSDMELTPQINPPEEPEWSPSLEDCLSEESLNSSFDLQNSADSAVDQTQLESHDTSVHDAFNLDQKHEPTPSPGKTVAEMIFASETSIESRAGAVRDTEQSSWDFDPPNPALVSDEIDRRIDEALALAGQMNVTDSIADNQVGQPLNLDLDDLELPAFLRSNGDMNPL